MLTRLVQWLAACSVVAGCGAGGDVTLGGGRWDAGVDPSWDAATGSQRRDGGRDDDDDDDDHRDRSRRERRDAASAACDPDGPYCGPDGEVFESECDAEAQHVDGATPCDRAQS